MIIVNESMHCEDPFLFSFLMAANNNGVVDSLDYFFSRLFGWATLNLHVARTPVGALSLALSPASASASARPFSSPYFPPTSGFWSYFSFLRISSSFQCHHHESICRIANLCLYTAL